MKIEKIVLQNLWSFIWYFVREYKFFAVMLVCFATITGFWSAFNSILMKYIIDSLNNAQTENIASFILWPAILLVLNLEVHNLSHRGLGYLNYKYQPLIKSKIISETFGYIHNHSQRFFQDNFAGTISNQIKILADNIENILHDYSRNIIQSIVLLIASFISMYFVHLKFFWVLFIWFLAFTSFSLYISKKLISLSEMYATSDAAITGKLVDSISNATNVRIFTAGPYEVSYLKKALLLTQKTFREKEIFEEIFNFIQGLSVSIMLGFMLYFLIQLHIQKIITVGDFVLILSLSVEVGFMIWWTMDQVSMLNVTIGKCKQSLSSLFVPLEIKDTENAKELLVTNGQIIFSRVKFYYTGTESLFDNKCVTIRAGEKVGLVGYSGSGKSTFINLVLRLYDINDGNIFIDDQDIRNVTQDSLRSNIGIIPQDPSLFHRSLMENIRYGRITATDEEVIEAAKRAYAHEFISKLPEGYDSLVGERGIKLSGGQRQRISIARVILKNAPILILDEATSQLDSVTENDIQESLSNFMQGKTTIIIAHRLSTLLYMDRILVFDQGRICEEGSHKELLKLNGLYKTLWNAQVGGFLPDQRGDNDK